MEHLFEIFEKLNSFGLPIPLSLLVVILYRVAVYKINKWPKREKHYQVLLFNLHKWKESLDTMAAYYQYPNTQYDELPDSYDTYAVQCREAKEAINAEMGYAKVFLSTKSVEKIENLLSEVWYQAEHGAISTDDYLTSILPLVKETYDSILKEAKRDSKMAIPSKDA